ncbi:MAG TPA: N-acetyl-gamma-glutamyl-phosphate reductase, partial [Vicinamibacteria bacterium]
MWSASIVGASGYAGGELLRLLLGHGDISVQQATSESFAGKPVTRAHPHLRGLTDLRFDPLESLRPVDLLFCSLPHGVASEKWRSLAPKAERILELSADFRRDPNFVYGIPELHRDEIRKARWVAGAGCNATAAILGLYPLFRAGLVEDDRTVVEVKAGSSEAGRKAT